MAMYAKIRRMFYREHLSINVELELPPLNGHIMFCLKEKKYDTKLQTCLPTGVSSADGGIGS
ncbi:MAG: hypothetical protein KA343_09275, partial [Nitrosomonas sp.]|nr:hypothetical protein [Nitrosomonas sp.]